MYLSTNDEVHDVDIDDNSQVQQTNTTPPTISNPSPSTSPCCSTLLVIDDNSNSNDSTVITNDIPINVSSPNAQTSQVQRTSSPSLSSADTSNDTPEQQRRRNSSIAKLLGGQPLNNQQYEEIHKQVLDDQSAQNVPSNNHDNKVDGEIQRLRNSITRTLLTNTKQNKNPTTTTNNSRLPSPEFSKDFEYLIRRELDIEHSPLTLQRDKSKPSIFQNLTSIRNAPGGPHSPTNSKLKRKRSQPKVTVPLPTAGKPTNNPPFTIRDPFELDSSGPILAPPMNPTNLHHSHHPQNDLFPFNGLTRHHRHQNQPPLLPQSQQQYSISMNSPTPINYQKSSISPYAQFQIHHDRSPATSSSSSPLNYARYPRTPELTLPSPVSPLSIHATSPSVISHQSIGTPSRKTKTICNRPDMFDNSLQRSFSNTSHQSNASLSSTSSSSSSATSDYCAPLKKRLLQTYKNEQRPSSSS